MVKKLFSPLCEFSPGNNLKKQQQPYVDIINIWTIFTLFKVHNSEVFRILQSSSLILTPDTIYLFSSHFLTPDNPWPPEISCLVYPWILLPGRFMQTES